MKFGVTNSVQLTAQLNGKRTVTKKAKARAGTHTLRLKTPKSLKAGMYSPNLLFEGTGRARTTVSVTR